MRIQYMSDLHLEFAPYTVEQLGDVLVLAGDIINGGEKSRARFENLLSECAGFDAVLMVIGNHEGYYTSFTEARQYLRRIEREFTNFKLLDMQSVTVDGLAFPSGVTFHGCPLWSNPEPNVINYAGAVMNDYRLIRGWDTGAHVYEHAENVDWLTKVVKPGDVVITHFPPSPVAINEKRYGGDMLNEWYTNDLESLIEELKPAAWISGHTHHTWNSKVGDTLILGNCRGYARNVGLAAGQPEVETFSDTQVLEIQNDETHESSGGASRKA